jgi:large subunit ribosomal protein L23
LKDAVEAEFKVTVLGVGVLWVKPNQKRRGRRTMGTVPGWRKAVVTIAAGQKIELFEAV